jgi:hypothetical protein
VRDPYADVVGNGYGSARVGPLVRHFDESEDDADPTAAMEREGPRSMREPNLAALRGRSEHMPLSTRERVPRPHADIAPQSLRRVEARVVQERPAPPPRYAPPEPIVRPAAASVAEASARPGAPYFVWIIASVLAGIISYHVAPELMARFDGPRHAQAAAQNAPPTAPAGQTDAPPQQP